MNYASQWAEVTSLSDKKFFRIEWFLMKHVLHRFGTPMMLISDGSMEFCSDELDALLERHGSQHQKYESEYTLNNEEKKEVSWELKRLFEKTVETTRGVGQIASRTPYGPTGQGTSYRWVSHPIDTCSTMYAICQQG